jgi:transcriptional regulator with XRE-family HTH domain
MTNNIHIGQMIKQLIDRRNITRTAIARKMQTPHTAIYAYEKRNSLKTATLLRLCHALEHNFFTDLANALPANYSQNTDFQSAKDLLIAQQTTEIQKLKYENDLLKELIVNKK